MKKSSKKTAGNPKVSKPKKGKTIKPKKSGQHAG
jgi:hypothetical protein